MERKESSLYKQNIEAMIKISLEEWVEFLKEKSANKAEYLKNSRKAITVGTEPVKRSVEAVLCRGL